MSLFVTRSWLHDVYEEIAKARRAALLPEQVVVNPITYDDIASFILRDIGAVWNGYFTGVECVTSEQVEPEKYQLHCTKLLRERSLWVPPTDGEKIALL